MLAVTDYTTRRGGYPGTSDVYRAVGVGLGIAKSASETDRSRLRRLGVPVWRIDTVLGELYAAGELLYERGPTANIGSPRPRCKASVMRYADGLPRVTRPAAVRAPKGSCWNDTRPRSTRWLRNSQTARG